MSQSNESNGPVPNREYFEALEARLLNGDDPGSAELRDAAAQLESKAPTLDSRNDKRLKYAAWAAVGVLALGAGIVKAGVHLPSSEENARLTSGRQGAAVKVGKKDDMPSTAQLGPSARALVLSGPQERTIKIMKTLGICGKELAAQSNYDNLRAQDALTTSAVADFTARADQEERAAGVLNSANIKCQINPGGNSKAQVPVGNLGDLSVRRDFITDFSFMSWHDQRDRYLTAQSWAAAHENPEAARDNAHRVAAGDQAFGTPNPQ